MDGSVEATARAGPQTPIPTALAAAARIASLASEEDHPPHRDVRAQARLRRQRRRRRRRQLSAAAAAIPWAWFLVRELGGALEFAEVAMPLWAPLIVIALVALARVVRQAAPLVAGLSLSVLAIGCVLGPWRPVPATADSVRSDTALSLAVGNIRHQGGPELLAALRARDADVVVLAELSEDADRGLSLLYPYRLRSTQALRPWSTERLPRSQRANQAGVGVYSRYPLQELPDLTGLAQGLPGVRATIDAPGGPVVLYALHLTKATPNEAYPSVSHQTQRQVAGALRDAIDAEQSPVIVAGDLNLVDRQETFRDFADGLRDAMRAGAWAGPTSAKESFVWRALLARIDHVLVTPSLCAASPERFELPTSDHHGLAVTVGPCATD